MDEEVYDVVDDVDRMKIRKVNKEKCIKKLNKQKKIRKIMK